MEGKIDEKISTFISKLKNKYKNKEKNQGRVNELSKDYLHIKTPITKFNSLIVIANNMTKFIFEIDKIEIEGDTMDRTITSLSGT